MDTHVCGTVPYPWPYDGSLVPQRTALVLCGAQRALVGLSEQGGEVLDRVVALADGVRSLGVSVVWVRHGGRTPRRATDVLPVRSSGGWQLASEPHAHDVVVDAPGWDGSFCSELDPVLRAGGTRTVVLAGFASEITVDSTVRTLNDRGHECLVLTDGCAPVDGELGARAHHSLTMSGGIFGALGTIPNLTAALAATTSEEEP
jgi:nicotinamidase-related amidase